ncbi:MAG: class I SAM-dependent methyltransferase [Clostridia bacterium]|nr:class I SAM-dependent methyltransferase [Clostridia bacterium]
MHMNDHYYTRDPASASRPSTCAFTWRGHPMTFVTDSGVFSKGELDRGTQLLLDALPSLSGEVLDLGCGWGAIGVTLAKAFPDARVTMADVNLRALSLAAENASRNGVSCETVESDGLSALRERRFDAIVTNPPIRAGKQVIYRLFAESADRLAPGGALYIVIRKQQGAESCVRYLESIGMDVEKLDRSSGFWVLRAGKTEVEA